MCQLSYSEKDISKLKITRETSGELLSISWGYKKNNNDLNHNKVSTT